MAEAPPQSPFIYPQQQQQQQHQIHVSPQPAATHNYTSPHAMNSHEKPSMHNYKSPEQSQRKWAFGLFECFAPLDVCCLAFWCPCYLFGKTYQRNKTGVPDADGFNGMCCAYFATLNCGCAPIVQCMQRQQTREKYGIAGDCCQDFLLSCCCSCCALIQEEKDSLVRTTGIDPQTGAVYQPVGQMTYA